MDVFIVPIIIGATVFTILLVRGLTKRRLDDHAQDNSVGHSDSSEDGRYH